MNKGQGSFVPSGPYRVGGGIYEVAGTAGSQLLTSLEATSGVAAGTFTAAGPPSLVALNPGSNTFSLLQGLGAGRFANPVTIPTASPEQTIHVVDIDGDGIPDAILLGSQGVAVYRGDGRGSFLPVPFTIGAGPQPIGLTLADVNHDGKRDLLVDNAFGDLLVLLGNGDGTFQPYRPERGAGRPARREPHPPLRLRRPGTR
jgi:hypothetical protein